MKDEADTARHDAILEAAGRLFVSQGFAATTTLAVARAARVSKRDLYRHFPTKQGLLDALVARYSQALTVPPYLPRPTSRGELFALLEVFGSRFLAGYLDPRRVAYLRLAITEAPLNPTLGQALLANGIVPVGDSLRRLFDGAATDGLLAAGDVDLVFDVFFMLLTGGWPLGLLLGTRQSPDEATVRRQAARAVEAVRRVISID
jgi:AcrR family transcriptional regulator